MNKCWLYLIPKCLKRITAKIKRKLPQLLIDNKNFDIRDYAWES